MDTPPTNHISLCSGYDGIGLGLKRAVPNLRTIAYSEIEAFACANLVAKMEAGLLDPAPVWTNVKTFPWADFRHAMEYGILSGGYPCQPFSAAGKRLGAVDPRHLWPWIRDGIKLLLPAIVFFENVEGHISLGLREVLADLAYLGYRVENDRGEPTWGIFSASEVGATHQRKRIFILGIRKDLADCCCPGLEGYAGDVDGKGRQSDGENRSITESSLRCWPSRPGELQYDWEPPRVVGNPESERPRAQRSEHEGSCGEPSITESGSAMADSTRIYGSGRGEELRRGRRVCEICEESPGDVGDTSNHYRRCGEHREKEGIRTFSERERGSSVTGDGKAESPVGGDFDGCSGGMDYAQLCVSSDSRIDELRLLGNGVVPATVEKAFRTLITRFYGHRKLD